MYKEKKTGPITSMVGEIGGTVKDQLLQVGFNFSLKATLELELILRQL